MSERRPAVAASRRRFVMTLTGAGVMLAGRGLAGAQARTSARKIGWLVTAPPNDSRWQAFRDALAERGWLEGRDFVPEWRPSSGRLDAAEQTAREFVAANVDLIVASTTASALAAQRATRTIPIVMIASGFRWKPAWRTA